jgi:hypothetical protein
LVVGISIACAWSSARASTQRDRCAPFEASVAHGRTSTTLFGLASCRERNAQLATAFDLYSEVVEGLHDATDRASVELRERAQGRMTALATRISWLVVDVPERSRIEGLVVTTENERLESGAWNEMLPVDAGTYRISAYAPGRRAWSTIVTIQRDADRQYVHVPLLARR